MTVDLGTIQAARERIKDAITLTPTMFFHNLSDTNGCQLHLKLELLQRCKSFKFRGAINKLRQLPKGSQVVCCSAGNHSQGTSLAATLSGSKAVVFMPEIAAPTKVAATRGYGGDVRLGGGSFDEAKARMTEEMKVHPEWIFVPPYDDADVISGAGTIGLEIFEQLPDADCVVVPIGGGGLIAGVSCALKTLKPSVRIIGVQNEFNCPVYRQFHAMKKDGLTGGRTSTIPTLADGIAVNSPGTLNMAMIPKYVDDVVLVSEDEITQAIVQLVERAKVVPEGAGAASYAAVAFKKFEFKPTDKICCVLSGGNIPAKTLSAVIERNFFLTQSRECFELFVPSSTQFSTVVSAIAATGAEVISCDRCPRTDCVVNEEKYAICIANATPQVMEQITKSALSRKWIPTIGSGNHLHDLPRATSLDLTTL